MSAHDPHTDPTTIPPRRRVAAGLGALALAGGVAAPAVPPPPATWTRDRLARATHVILDPQVRGNAALIDGPQRAGVLRAMHRDTGTP